MNKKTILILSLVSLNLLTSCTDSTEKLESNVITKQDNIYTNFEKKADSKIKWSNIINKVTNINDDSVKELTIDERCIWCGKCAMIAPENFAMDFNTLKAVVISQKNMFSQEVSTSVQVCPTDSIHII